MPHSDYPKFGRIWKAEDLAPKLLDTDHLINDKVYKKLTILASDSLLVIRKKIDLKKITLALCSLQKVDAPGSVSSILLKFVVFFS